MDLSKYKGHTQVTQLCVMTDADTGKGITPEAFGVYAQKSMERSAEETGGQAMLFLWTEKGDGGADVAILGNGPTSAKNGLLFQDAPRIVEYARSLERRLVELQEAVRGARPNLSEDCWCGSCDSALGVVHAPCTKLREALHGSVIAEQGEG